MEKKSIGDVWKEVFSKPKYIMISVLMAILFYILTAILAHLRVLSWSSFIPFILGFHRTLMPFSLITTILISLLFGFLFSLLIYRTKELESISDKSNIWITLGIFFGLLAPGCAACGIGIISLIGIGGAAIALLPLKGLEVSILAILLLCFSIYKISKTISRGIVCEIDPKMLNRAERRLKND